MAFKDTIFVTRITGDKELDKALRQLGGSEMKSVIKAGITGAGRHIAKEATENAKAAPFKDSTGALWRSIGVKRVRQIRGGIDFEAKIGPRSMFVKNRKASKEAGTAVYKDRFAKDFGGRNPRKYAHLIEFGTKNGTKQFNIFRKALFGKADEHRDIAFAMMRAKLPAAIKRARIKAGAIK